MDYLLAKYAEAELMKLARKRILLSRLRKLLRPSRIRRRIRAIRRLPRWLLRRIT